LNRKGYKRYVTVLLTVAYVFNQADRGVFGFLMQPIKDELHLSDSELGFAGGPALVLFYVVLGIPIARLADRSNRATLITIGVSAWSIMAMLSAAVGNFWQLVLVRVGVGVGEAGFTAMAQSLIAEYHSSAERPRAMSTLQLAIPIGLVISSAVGGWVNELYGWRAAFIAAGLPGVLIAALIKVSIKDPRVTDPRSAAEAARGEDLPRFTEILKVLWKQGASRHLLIASACANLVAASALSWLPGFFSRTHGMSAGQIGTWFGVMVFCGGGIGTWLGGYLASRRGNIQTQCRLLAIGSALSCLFVAAVLLSPTKELALFLLLPATVAVYFFYGPTFSLAQSFCSPGTRATVASVFILIQVLAGGVIGVQLVGILSDQIAYFFGEESLRWSLLATSIAGLWAAVHFWLAGTASERAPSLAGECDEGDGVTEAGRVAGVSLRKK